jgi:hypothetical protein
MTLWSPSTRSIAALQATSRRHYHCGGRGEQRSRELTLVDSLTLKILLWERNYGFSNPARQRVLFGDGWVSILFLPTWLVVVPGSKVEFTSALRAFGRTATVIVRRLLPGPPTRAFRFTFWLKGDLNSMGGFIKVYSLVAILTSILPILVAAQKAGSSESLLGFEVSIVISLIFPGGMRLTRRNGVTIALRRQCTVLIAFSIAAAPVAFGVVATSRIVALLQVMASPADILLILLWTHGALVITPLMRMIAVVGR